MDKEKQIEEMATVAARSDDTCRAATIAKALYRAGYRKQIEGEWTRFEVNGINYGQVYYQHKECKANETQLFPTSYNFCPNCGAKMKGEVNAD